MYLSSHQILPLQKIPLTGDNKYCILISLELMMSGQRYLYHPLKVCKQTLQLPIVEKLHPIEILFTPRDAQDNSMSICVLKC